MELKLQIFSLIFSFIFGYLFYFTIYFLDNIKIKLLKYILSLFIILVMSLLYFWGLLYINNGYLHVYFLFMIIIGYLLNSFLTKRYFTHFKKRKM